MSEIRDSCQVVINTPIGTLGTMAPPNNSETRVPQQTDLASLAAMTGPVLSIFMDTHEYGRESAQDGVRFTGITKEVSNQLLASGHDRSWVKTFLAPLAELADDALFWQHQRSSLALYRSADEFLHFRLAQPQGEIVSIADNAYLPLLLPHINQISPFLLLALSKNDVRLYECDADVVREVTDSTLPKSFDEALQFEDPESQLQFRTAGAFGLGHSHGIGDEVAKERLERFLQAVDRAITAQEVAPVRPLLLAAVEHNVARFQQLSTYPALLPEHLPGNPDRLSPADLHHDAVELLTARATAARIAEVDDVRSLTGTGRLEITDDAIAQAAREGRVEKLYVHRSSGNPALLNDAMIATIRSGGDVVHAPVAVIDGVDAFAVTRW